MRNAFQNKAHIKVPFVIKGLSKKRGVQITIKNIVS